MYVCNVCVCVCIYNVYLSSNHSFKHVLFSMTDKENLMNFLFSFSNTLTSFHLFGGGQESVKIVWCLLSQELSDTSLALFKGVLFLELLVSPRVSTV